MASLDQAFGRNPAQLSGDIQITRGVLQTDNLKFSGQGHIATTSTTVDLPRWDFNLTTELVDDPHQMPLVMFSATGPIDAPSKTRVGGRLLSQGAASAEERRPTCCNRPSQAFSAEAPVGHLKLKGRKRSIQENCSKVSSNNFSDNALTPAPLRIQKDKNTYRTGQIAGSAVIDF